MKKQPEKTAQTRKELIDAFWKIAEEKGLDKVSVSEVTKSAGFNRGTFYVYFTDLDDLLFQSEEEILEELFKRMASVLSEGIRMDMDDTAVKVVEALAMYDEKLFLLLGKKGDPNFISMFRQKAATLFGLIFEAEASPYQEYIIAYVTSAFVGILSHWHESGRKIPLEEVSAICRTLAIGGILALRQENSVCRKYFR